MRGYAGLLSQTQKRSVLSINSNSQWTSHRSVYIPITSYNRIDNVVINSSCCFNVLPRRPCYLQQPTNFRSFSISLGVLNDSDNQSSDVSFETQKIPTSLNLLQTKWKRNNVTKIKHDHFAKQFGLFKLSYENPVLTKIKETRDEANEKNRERIRENRRKNRPNKKKKEKSLFEQEMDAWREEYQKSLNLARTGLPPVPDFKELYDLPEELRTEGWADSVIGPYALVEKWKQQTKKPFDEYPEQLKRYINDFFDPRNPDEYDENPTKSQWTELVDQNTIDSVTNNSDENSSGSNLSIPPEVTAATGERNEEWDGTSLHKWRIENRRKRILRIEEKLEEHGLLPKGFIKTKGVKVIPLKETPQDTWKGDNIYTKEQFEEANIPNIDEKEFKMIDRIHATPATGPIEPDQATIERNPTPPALKMPLDVADEIFDEDEVAGPGTGIKPFSRAGRMKKREKDEEEATLFGGEGNVFGSDQEKMNKKEKEDQLKELEERERVFEFINRDLITEYVPEGKESFLKWRRWKPSPRLTSLVSPDIDYHIRFTSVFRMDPDIALGPKAMRDFRGRKLKLTVAVGALCLPEPAEQRLISLVGSRYDAKSDQLTLVCDKFPTKNENMMYARQLLKVLIEESMLGDPNYIPESDLEVDVEQLSKIDLPPMPEDGTYRTFIFPPTGKPMKHPQKIREQNFAIMEELLNQLSMNNKLSVNV